MQSIRNEHLSWQAILMVSETLCPLLALDQQEVLSFATSCNHHCQYLQHKDILKQNKTYILNQQNISIWFTKTHLVHEFTSNCAPSKHLKIGIKMQWILTVGTCKSCTKQVTCFCFQCTLVDYITITTKCM